MTHHETFMSANRLSNVWKPILLLLLTIAASTTQFPDVYDFGVVRPYVVFLFLCICPGMSLIGLVALDFFSELALSVALSLVLLTLTSEVLLLVPSWPLEISFWFLVAVSVFGIALQFVSVWRGRGALRELPFSN